MRTGFLALAALAVAGCEGPLSTLDPAGEEAAAIALLWWIMLAGATVILVGVMAAALVPLRPRHRPLGLSERAMLVGGGLVFPGVTLFALLLFALIEGERLRPRDEPGIWRVEAHARQWDWDFVYPDAPGGPLHTSSELHVPAGQPFQVHVTSHDVIHSFWVPRLGGKIDAIPGRFNVIRLEADRPGLYAGPCAEFCGSGHAGMGLVVHAHPPEELEARLGRAAALEEPRE